MILEYINHKYDHPIFDELKYATGVGTINENFDQQGIIGLYIHAFYFQTQNTGALFTVSDQFNIELFSGNDNIGFAYYPMPLIRPGNILKITVTIPTLHFNISYQKLFARDPRDGKKKHQHHV